MREAVDYYSASTLDEARGQLLQYGDDARIVSGGTALAVLMRQDLVRPKILVGIREIPSLSAISIEDGKVTLGAAVRLRTAERNGLLLATWPMLAEAIAAVATPRIRNMATIGGGLAHADPAQDPPVAFCAAEASIIIHGNGVRRIQATEFCTGYYENALEPGEIVVGVELPPPPPRTGGSYLKFLPRSAEDYGVVTAAAVVTMDEHNRCRKARLVVGAVADRPRAIDIDQMLIGEPLTESAARAAAELVRDTIDPVDDVRGSSYYKREMAVVFARRALLEAARRAMA